MRLMSYIYINSAYQNMRKDPSFDSTVVSQARFAEPLIKLQHSDNWVEIQTPDLYQGWVPKDCLLKKNTPYEGNLKISRLAAHVYKVKDTEFGPICTLPYGVKLQSTNSEDSRWVQVQMPNEEIYFIQKGDVAEEEPLQSKEDLTQFSKKFLNLPYTWGGRTSFGFDCSGFIQMLYEQIGISLPRDAKQQVHDPRFTKISLKRIQPGDLIFWGKSPETISHVGMYIGQEEFIHSVVSENKPWIRISKIDEPSWREDCPDRPYRTAVQLIPQKDIC